MNRNRQEKDAGARWQEILTFWFEEIDASSWWKRDELLDRTIAERFGKTHKRAFQGELFEWRRIAGGRLAEIIVLDQFSRNMFRGGPRAFAADPMALALAQEAVAAGADLELAPVQRVFIYLPYMHSESLKIHDVALELFEKNGLSENLDFEKQHQRIIERFGRYPHRNQALGRESTPEELEFLTQPGSSF